MAVKRIMWTESIPDVVKSSKKVLLVLIQWIYTLDSTTQSLKNKGPVLQQNAMQFHNLLKGNGQTFVYCLGLVKWNIYCRLRMKDSAKTLVLFTLFYLNP